MDPFDIGLAASDIADSLGMDEALRFVRKRFRKEDESHLWPIKGRFNVTERAIRHLRESGMVIDDPLGYALELDREISRIVNDENNW